MKFEDMINHIILGDCYELVKDIPNDSIDLIIIDPPYEFDMGGNGGAFGRRKREYINEYLSLDTKYQKEYKRVLDKTKNKEKARTEADKLKQRENIRFISSGFDFKLLDEFERIMKKINIYIWCSKAQVRKILDYYENKGCNIDILTWHKDDVIPTCNNTYLSDTEYLIFAREKNVKLYGTVESKRKYYVSHCNRIDKSKYKHPTIKPINIIKNLIVNSSLEGDIVLDCFSGSGTTAVACKELNRRFIGIEINEEYYKISQDRLNGILANGQISFDTKI